MKGIVIEHSQGEGQQRNGNKEVLESCPSSSFCYRYNFIQKAKDNHPHPSCPCCERKLRWVNMPVLSSISAIIRSQLPPESSWRVSWGLTRNPVVICWLPCFGAEMMTIENTVSQGALEPAQLRWGCYPDVMGVPWVAESRLGRSSPSDTGTSGLAL